MKALSHHRHSQGTPSPSSLLSETGTKHHPEKPRAQQRKPEVKGTRGWADGAKRPFCLLGWT